MRDWVNLEERHGRGVMGSGYLRRRAAALLVMALPALVGCSGFFVPVNGGGGGGGGASSNNVYVANSVTNSVSGFAVGTGTLKAVPNSPLALGYSPVAMVVTPSNSFLYVAGASSINVYPIGTDGSLTVLSGGNTAAVATVVSLDVSPDGNWLFGLDGLQQKLDVYQINTATGGLAVAAAVPYPVQDGVWIPRMVRVSPNGTLVFAALGTAGDAIFTFNTATGVAVHSEHLNLATNASDNALAVDSNSAYLYVARSGVGPGVAVYTIGAGGHIDPVTGSPFAAGTQTYSVVLDSTGKYVYAANRGDSTISGYAIGAGGVLTALSGSPYASGSQVTSLGRDRSGAYVLAAAANGAPDLTMYSFSTVTPGALVKATSVATDTAPAGAIAVALTH
jgi:6-phosphogluconolactonase